MVHIKDCAAFFYTPIHADIHGIVYMISATTVNIENKKLSLPDILRLKELIFIDNKDLTPRKNRPTQEEHGQPKHKNTDHDEDNRL